MANETAQKVHEVVGRILSDPGFAEQIKNQGLEAIRGGAGSDAWNTYFDNFAASPGALSRLGGTNASAADCTCNSNTFITLSSLVTPVPTCCAATTTTTTSGS